jgi:hypothetical protein
MDRRARVLALLADGDPAQPMPDRVCAASVKALGINGAGISVISSDAHRVVVSGTDEASRQLEDLQFVLGDGPCVEACTTGGPVIVPDLAAEKATRWPGLATASLAAGIRAVFAFPLQIGAIRLGAIDFYRDRTGPLDDEALADALVFADVATLALLTVRTTADENVTDWLAGAPSVVYQASGMVRVHLGIGIDDALLRMRAYAFAHNLPISTVGKLIVSEQLRLENE